MRGLIALWGLANLLRNWFRHSQDYFCRREIYFFVSCRLKTLICELRVCAFCGVPFYPSNHTECSSYIQSSSCELIVALSFFVDKGFR